MAGVQQTSRCNEETGASGERAQVYGDLFTSTDFLLALQGIYMVREAIAKHHYISKFILGFKLYHK